MKEFAFQCGCGYRSEIPNYMDAAEHYVFCLNTHWWKLTCTGCNDFRRVDATPSPHEMEPGEPIMIWCIEHLIKCFKKSPEALRDDMQASVERYEQFFIKNIGRL